MAGAPEFNGKKGKVIGFKDDRVRVEFLEGGEKALKPANLKLVDLLETVINSEIDTWIRKMMIGKSQ